MVTNDRMIAYAAISALDIGCLRQQDENGLDRIPFGALKLVEGRYPTSLADDEILLNRLGREILMDTWPDVSIFNYGIFSMTSSH